MEQIYIDQKYNNESLNGKLIEFENGIEYIKYKRRVESYIEPVIFTSFYPKDEILISIPRSTIIDAIGHNFLQRPYSPKQFEKVKSETRKLNEIQLRDIVINFCEERSALRQGFHDLKGKLRSIKELNENLVEKTQKITNELNNFKKELSKDYSDYPRVIDEFARVANLFEPSNIESVDYILNENEESFSKFIPVEDDLKNNKLSENQDWEVMFLDDRPSELTSIFKELSKKQIKFHVAETFNNAQEIINKDIYNKILVVVSDYRLFKIDTPTRMQEMQGYDFLIWLSQKPRYNSLIALSGLSKWFLLDSFRRSNINVKVYSKNGLAGGGIKLFFDDIEHLASRQLEVIHSQPKGSHWKEGKSGKNPSFPLKPYYIFHRNHKDYLKNEDDINKKCEKIARELEYALDNNSNFNFASISSIKGGISTTLSSNFENDYAHFLKKLMFRRLYYYLQLKGLNKNSIIKLLHKGDIEADVKSGMINQLLNNLAIQTETDLPYNILIEEKYFLNDYMQIPIFSMARMMDQSHSIINSFLSDHLSDSDRLLKDLKRFIISKDARSFVKTVSLSETNTVLKIISEILYSEGKADLLNKLLISIITVYQSLNDILPDKNSVQENVKFIQNLQRKYLQ